ncbi:MAG: Ribulose bisphosphate carboxylase small chain, partial [uncultured Acetobacteraceae bacterium]
AHHPGHLQLPARPHRRPDQGPSRLLPRERLGGEHRIHRRPAPAQHVLGHVGQPDVRPEGPGGRDVRTRRVPEGARRPRLHPRFRLRRLAGLGKPPPLLHHRPTQGGAGLHAGAAGRGRPPHQLHDPGLRRRQTRGRALL